MSKKMEFHELANIFPMMTEAEESSLRVSIAGGFDPRFPIITYENKILDGRNRYNACIEVGLEPVYEEYSGDDPRGYVIRANLERRHLNEAQRSLCAAKLANLTVGDNRGAHRPGEGSANLPTLTGVSQSEAAELLQVSERSLRSAKKTLENGIPELIELFERGEVPVSVAESIAKLPKKEQKKVVAAILKDKKRFAKEWAQYEKKNNKYKSLPKNKKRSAEKPNKPKKPITPKSSLQQYNRSKKAEELSAKSSDNSPLPTKKTYPIIYADPPWKYEQASTESRAIENQYPTMTLSEICNLPVRSMTTEDCVLFLWATSPKLEEAITVVNSWGFTYKTNMVWVKKGRKGMGYYARQNHELLLIATKGSGMSPIAGTQPDSVQEFPRGKHSQKPKQFYDIIESMYPGFSRIELFARGSKRNGWDNWGNEAQSE